VVIECKENLMKNCSQFIENQDYSSLATALGKLKKSNEAEQYEEITNSLALNLRNLGKSIQKSSKNLSDYNEEEFQKIISEGEKLENGKEQNKEHLNTKCLEDLEKFQTSTKSNIKNFVEKFLKSIKSSIICSDEKIKNLKSIKIIFDDLLDQEIKKRNRQSNRQSIDYIDGINKKI
jgi:hypothetical protein